MPRSGGRTKHTLTFTEESTPGVSGIHYIISCTCGFNTTVKTPEDKKRIAKQHLNLEKT